MIELRKALDQLLAFLGDLGAVVPFRTIRIIEVGEGVPVDSKGRLVVTRADLFTFEEYADRYKELRNMNPPWINVSCYGKYVDSLVVALELPRLPWSSSGSTIVRYSGPSRGVLEAGWDLDSVLLIE